MDGPATRGVALKRLGRMPLLLIAVLALTTMAMAFIACGDDDDENGNGNGVEPTAASTDAATEPADDLSGDIEGDGSSTVFLIAEAVGEEFMALHSGVNVLVGESGTSGGFEKFCAGETDFSNASRAIKQEEIDACTAGAVEYTEFEIAYDGLAVVTNPSSDFVDCLTVDELKKIWEPAADRTITNWSQVRDGFPDKALVLYGPGTDSGTFDYFTAEIVGEEGSSRSDYTPSEDDNVLVQGVAGDESGLAYFGLAYAVQNSSQLRLLSVDGGGGCVAPSAATVLDGTYTPLARPLFVYVRNDALARPEMEEFIRFWLTEGPALAEEVGYVKSPDASYQEGLAKLP